VWWENKNICRWPILLVISVPKISVQATLVQLVVKNVGLVTFFETQCIVFSAMIDWQKSLMFLPLRTVVEERIILHYLYIYMSVRSSVIKVVNMMFCSCN